MVRWEGELKWKQAALRQQLRRCGSPIFPPARAFCLRCVFPDALAFWLGRKQAWVNAELRPFALLAED